MRLLVVEDDALLRDSLLVGLRLSGFTPDGVATCSDASEALVHSQFDGIVLDRMLPDGSGLDWLKAQRGQGMALPVLMLTARDRVPDRVDGLDGGADDYMGKPFDLDELAARLRAMLRRGEGARGARDRMERPQAGSRDHARHDRRGGGRFLAPRACGADRFA
ncbi:response regulator [Paracoccus cavernae]|uniref:response regulator n=1 Tax=Paracoccus cavernae TaxID=1571207 RepID=UPI00362FB5A0